ncbi:hypothetical protein LCGC14_2445580 [marine sediment metagenome]|uniref:Uncharacterized protein n=1 Tax=marine sediment metagenome TaxID=412755 RepID=A0A0F9EBH7_9ZZZZ
MLVSCRTIGKNRRRASRKASEFEIPSQQGKARVSGSRLLVSKLQTKSSVALAKPIKEVGEVKNILPNKNPSYWEHTEKCPHCFGRGRVPKENYSLEPDTYKEVYEEEKAIEEAENIINTT